jgi:hypothetical protein
MLWASNKVWRVSAPRRRLHLQVQGQAVMAAVAPAAPFSLCLSMTVAATGENLEIERMMYV